MAETQIGEITHYFNNIHVGVLALTGAIEVGDTIHITGASTDFNQEVSSLQIDHGAVEAAGPGDEVAMKVVDRVRAGDKIFRVDPD